MADLISRQAAIDALVGITMFKTKHELMQRVNASVQDEQGWLGAVAECLDEIEDLPSAQPEQKVEELLPDGTLHLFTDTDLSKVNRVWVSQNGTHYGDLYYADEDLNCGARMEGE